MCEGRFKHVIQIGVMLAKYVVVFLPDVRISSTFICDMKFIFLDSLITTFAQSSLLIACCAGLSRGDFFVDVDELPVTKSET